MNVNKYFSFAIVVFLMAVPLVLVVKTTIWMMLKSFSRS